MRWFLILLISFNAWGETPKIRLSLQDVVDRVVKDSDRKEEIDLQRYSADILPARELRQFDWGLGLDINYTDTEAENLGGFNDIKRTESVQSIALQKRFTTGSTTLLQFERTNLARVPGGFSSQLSLPSEQTQDLFTFELQQNLWQNAFGSIDRLMVAKAREQVTQAELQRVEDLENHLLTTMRLYWQTYVAKESLEEAMQSRGRYDDLLRTVKKKARYKFSSPGELERTKAEYEVRDQTVKLRSQEYLKLLDQLLIELNMPIASEVEFAISDDLPGVPEPPPVKIDGLRSLKIIKHQIENSHREIRIQKSKSGAELNFVGRVQSTGIEREQDLALSEMTSFDKPTYYAGLSLKFLIDNSNADAEVKNALVQKQLQEIKLKQERERIQAELRHLGRQAQAAYLIAQSKNRAFTSRKKAFKEIHRAYKRGRVDFSELILADNSLSIAQTEKIKAIGDYQISLNEWAAMRDTLIK